MTEHVRKRRLAVRLAHLPAYVRLGTAVLVGAIAAFALPGGWPREVRLVASWDGFAISSLLTTWFTILALRPEHIRRVARMEDPSRVLTLVLVVLGAAAALFAVLVLLQSSLTMEGALKKGAIVLALSAVVLAWLLIHTVFTLRYAHLFHGAPDGMGGLQFPGGEDCPEYLDLAYFAFVIGMTAQTSDVAVTTRVMRMNVLIHSVISFAFNTAVVALSIGVLTTLF